MAKFKFEMSKKDAILAVKKALDRMAILSDKNDCLTVGTPLLMEVKIHFAENELTTEGVLFGKLMVATVDSAIELAEGFEKV